MCEIHVFLLLNLFCHDLCTFVANWFVAIYALLCGEKMTNIRYVIMMRMASVQ